MRILITGGKGMLGRTLQRRLTSHEIMVADLPEVDILSASSLEAAFSSFRPELVIHCAAMTKVDDCESRPDQAFSLNRDGTANVAKACLNVGARLIAISTDYVFSGDKEGEWIETDVPSPKTVYGKSKLEGERSALAALPSAVILRIAWLYGEGGPSFVHTMLKLGEQDGAPLKVVNDQRGNPTSADVVADEISFLMDHPEVRGIVHGTCDGVCSWYEFTREIFRLKGIKREVLPCTTAEFPRPAPRPANSALANTVLEGLGYHVPSWQLALKVFLSNL